MCKENFVSDLSAYSDCLNVKVLTADDEELSGDREHGGLLLLLFCSICLKLIGEPGQQ